MELEFTFEVNPPAHLHALGDFNQYSIARINSGDFRLMVSKIGGDLLYQSDFLTLEEAKKAAQRIEDGSIKAFCHPAPEVFYDEETGEIELDGCAPLELSIGETIDDTVEWRIDATARHEPLFAFPTERAALDFLAVMQQALAYFQDPKNP